jgi:hypothetical protein
MFIQMVDLYARIDSGDIQLIRMALEHITRFTPKHPRFLFLPQAKYVNSDHSGLFTKCR